MDWFKIGKETTKRLYVVTLLFNLYAEYIMQNAGLDESQGRIKTAGRNINNLRHADDTTLMAETEEERKAFWWGARRVGKKAGLKLNIQKTKIMASGPITSWKIEGENWKQWHILFSWSLKSLQTVTAAMKLKDACSLEDKVWQT